MPRGKAVATRSQSQAALIQERLDRNKARVKVATGNKIKMDKRKQTFEVDGKSLDAMGGVIVEFAYFNRFDIRPYKEGDPTPPDCFACAPNEDEMKPDPSCPAPQADSCSVCPHNEFDGGRKACRNKIRLAILPVGDPDAEIQVLEAPPTSLKSLKIAIKQIHDAGGDHAAFTYEFAMDKTSEWAKFSTVVTGDNPDYEAMLNRLSDAESALKVEYDYTNAPAQPKKSTRRTSRARS